MQNFYPFLLGVATLGLLEGIYSLWRGIGFLRLFQKSHGRPSADYTPPVVLILPCRGVDPGLHDNLAAYFQLDYPDFRILLVTGDQLDSCVPVLEQVRAAHHRVESSILFSGKTRTRSQKVHNLLHAVEQLRGRDQVLAFGDSDIRPSKRWLRCLVAPLEDPKAGLVTGFRWYLPQRGNFASVLRSVWNAGIASLMSEDDCLFAWGGAMAVRRDIFNVCRVSEYWMNALSDDYAISRAIHDHSLTIRFEPHCLSFSHEDCELKELLDWTDRQLLITRIYKPGIWTIAFLSQMLYSLTLGSGLAVVLSNLWRFGSISDAVSAALAGVAAVVYLLGCVKAWIRVRALSMLFPEHEIVLRKHVRAYVLWGPLASLLSLLGLVRSAFKRDIEWRGIRYRMLSPEKTLVLE